MADVTQAKAVKAAYPDINWDRFEDIDRALDWELWHGPLPPDYWTDVEPLTHYKWEGFTKAEQDIRDILEPLPWEMFFDADGECVTEENPENDDYNYRSPCSFCEEWLHQEDGVWVDDTGGDVCSGDDNLDNENEPHQPDWSKTIWVGGEWLKFNTREALMYVETYKQVF